MSMPPNLGGQWLDGLGDLHEADHRRVGRQGEVVAPTGVVEELPGHGRERGGVDLELDAQRGTRLLGLASTDIEPAAELVTEQPVEQLATELLDLPLVRGGRDPSAATRAQEGVLERQQPVLERQLVERPLRAHGRPARLQIDRQLVAVLALADIDLEVHPGHGRPHLLPVTDAQR